MILYLLTNTVNGKYYVGKTVSENLGRYLSVKRWQAKNGNPSRMPIVAAIAKYGFDKFEVKEICRTVNADILDDIEKAWIADLDSRNPEKGYNIQEGGGTGRTGMRLTDEHKAKIGAANKGKKPAGYIRTETHLQQRRDAMKGNTLGAKFTSGTGAVYILNETPEQKLKRSASIKAAWSKRKLLKGLPLAASG